MDIASQHPIWLQFRHLNSWSMHIASAEPSAVTAADGSYVIPNLPNGTYSVDLAPQSGWTDTNPASGVQQVTISNGAIVSNVNFVTEEGTAPQSPVLAGIEAGALTYTEDETAAPVTSALTVSDAESANLVGATVWISGNYQSGQDVLSFANTTNITGSWNAATGTLTLSGSDTLADYQAALRAVKYDDTSSDPSAATRTISFQVNDGQAESNVATRQIALDPAIALGPPTLPADTADFAYNEAITASGGTGSVALVVSNIQNPINGLNVPAGGSGSLSITRHAHGRRDGDLHGHGHRHAGGSDRDHLYHYRQSGRLAHLAHPGGRHRRRGLCQNDHGQRRHRQRRARGEQHPERH